MMLSPRLPLVLAALAGFALADMQERIDTKVGPRRGNNVQYNSGATTTQQVNFGNQGREGLQPTAVQQVSSGRALDSNLMSGSGGYNHATPSFGVFSQPKYAPGMTQSIYTLNRYGETVYNEYNAFTPPRYDPTGAGVAGARAGSGGTVNYAGHTTVGTQHRGYAPTYHGRFRYQGR